MTTSIQDPHLDIGPKFSWDSHLKPHLGGSGVSGQLRNRKGAVEKTSVIDYAGELKRRRRRPLGVKPSITEATLSWRHYHVKTVITAFRTGQNVVARCFGTHV